MSASQDPALLRRLLRAKDRMDAASHEEWPVERLASVSGVSQAHFARSFKRAFGAPPHRYLLTRRIERGQVAPLVQAGKYAAALTQLEQRIRPHLDGVVTSAFNGSPCRVEDGVAIQPLICPS